MKVLLDAAIPSDARPQQKRHPHVFIHRRFFACLPSNMYKALGITL